MTNKPMIGITVNSDGGCLALGFGCEQAILAAGGIPVLLPMHLDTQDALQLMSRCDGILFSGGVDLDPVYFGEPVLAKCGGIDALRDAAEKAYFDAARQLRLPMMGICRGHQVINALMGGDLYQDLDSQFIRERPLQHRSAGAGDALLHDVTVAEGSLLKNVVKLDRMRVTSTHHQAVRRVAPGLKATGMSEDGVVEVLESDGEDFILTVQFHPELRFSREQHALALFQSFTGAAARYASAKAAAENSAADKE